MTDDLTPTPTRLVLFPEGTSPVRERRRRIFLALWVLVSAGLIWPVHPFVAGLAPPLVLGWPFSLVWVVFLLGVMFCAVLWLYLGDLHTVEDV